MEKMTPSHLRQGQAPHCSSVMPTFSGEAEGPELGSTWSTWRVLIVIRRISKGKERRAELRKPEQRRREDRRGEERRRREERRGGEQKEGRRREGSMRDEEKIGRRED